MENGCLMKVESIAECSPWVFIEGLNVHIVVLVSIKLDPSLRIYEKIRVPTHSPGDQTSTVLVGFFYWNILLFCNGISCCTLFRAFSL